MVWVLTYCTELWGQWLVDWSCWLLLGPGIPFFEKGWLWMITIKSINHQETAGFSGWLQHQTSTFLYRCCCFLYFLFVNLCSPRMKAWKMRPWKKNTASKMEDCRRIRNINHQLKTIGLSLFKVETYSNHLYCLMLSPLVFHRPWKIGEINKVGSYSTSYKWGYSSYK